MRLAAQAKGGFYPTPPRVTGMLGTLVRTPYTYRGRNQETLRVLDPCCGAGEALAQLADAIRTPGGVPVETYGVELHRERAAEAAGVLDHALGADLFATSIANGAFGLLLLNPPYDYDSETKRTEHRFLTHCTRYLAHGGLLVFIVPRARLSVSARYLASHYGRLRCWAFPAPEVEAFDQVAVLGYRREEPALDARAEEQLLAWVAGEPEALEPHRYPLYAPPASSGGPVLFTTRTVDPAAAAAEARRAGLWASRDVTAALWPEAAARTRPLMPLRRGHMAMLVAAGFLDNLVLEGGEGRVLVKGRTGKAFELVEDTPDKEVYRERLTTSVMALDLWSGAITDIAA